MLSVSYLRCTACPIFDLQICLLELPPSGHRVISCILKATLNLQAKMIESRPGYSAGASDIYKLLYCGAAPGQAQATFCCCAETVSQAAAGAWEVPFTLLPRFIIKVSKKARRGAGRVTRRSWLIYHNMVFRVPNLTTKLCHLHKVDAAAVPRGA